MSYDSADDGWLGLSYDSADDAAVEPAADKNFDDSGVPLQIMMTEDYTAEEMDVFRAIRDLQMRGMEHGILLEERAVMEHYVAGDSVGAAFYNLVFVPLDGDTEEERVACARMRAEVSQWIQDQL